MSIAKDIPYIMMDEPTANLDERNARFIGQVINELKKKGKGIVIATHNPSIYEADKIIEIKDGVMNEVIINEKESQETNVLEDKSYSSFKIIRAWNKKNRLYPIVFTLLLGVSVCFAALSLTQGNAIHDMHRENMSISDCEPEICVWNEVVLDENDVKVDNFDPAMTDYQINALKKIKELDSMYPLYIFGQVGRCYIDGEEKYKKEDMPRQIEVVFADGKVGKVDTSQYIDLGGSHMILAWENDDPQKECTQYHAGVKKGIYITQEFASQIGLTSIEGVSLCIPVFVPVADVKQEIGLMGIENEKLSTIEGRLPINVLTKIELPIKGIKKQTIMMCI